MEIYIEIQQNSLEPTNLLNSMYYTGFHWLVLQVNKVQTHFRRNLKNKEKN